ncbi:MAG: Asp-tRNA(Asn)/Glu-tRNA(Gln) amidotransferase subunit GatC [Holosporaceae bacterium]|jgi:aspartyl-tRNA(Asn)/glutamyl-tRNA(Gln) amidotransferase subunit C|nr:Asp-tRNA(Asn)/Glu-tRNA(Gln) amidotransferase subunit GatC [Holosporaceae bacterium]
MSITESDVRKVSFLARIRIDDAKISQIQDSLNCILSFIEQLKEVDCSQVDDTIQYATLLHERKDIAIACDPAVMDNAPEKECNMFIVPKVVG